MTREELIELMARAFGPDRIEIAPGHEGCDICLDARKTLLDEAQAVLSAIESSGLAIVPVEPTEAMITAKNVFVEKGMWLRHPDVREWNGTANGDSIESWRNDYDAALFRSFLSANPLKPHE